MYYFGYFDISAAKLMQQGYIKDLVSKGARIVRVIE